MGDAPQKRKERPDGPSSHGGPATKRSKGGQAGRWKTPHQKTKVAEKVEMGKIMSVQDKGIWVTFARGMNTKAVREFKELCETYGESLYDIPPPHIATDGVDDEEEGDDIEASIEKELNAIKASSSKEARSQQAFKPISTGLECLFFMKTLDPVDPKQLVLKMCEDARDCPNPTERKTKYINRLTPVSDTDKATENGISKVAQKVLGPHFDLVEPPGSNEDDALKPKVDEEISGCTYAIRQNIRNNDIYKSEHIIKKIAGMVAPRHRVNLTSPDKIILVEIYQLFCGISVVDGKQWEELKKYNVNALYSMAKDNGGQEKFTAQDETRTRVKRPAESEKISP